MRPSIIGRVLLEPEAGGLRARFELEVYGGVFTVEGRLVDARDSARQVNYTAILEVDHYYYPLRSPLPIPSNPYALVDFSIVYTVDPRFNVVHTPNDSTTVITTTKYVLSEGLGYSHLLVQRGGLLRSDEESEALWAYPVLPRQTCLRRIVELEYMLARRGHTSPTLTAIRTLCEGCKSVIDANMGLVMRAAHDIAVEASRLGCRVEPSRLGRLRVIVEKDHVVIRGVGVVNLCVRCRGEKYILSRCVAGEAAWRMGEGCVIEGYSTFCPC